MIDIDTASANEIDAVEQLKRHAFEIAGYREDRGRFWTSRASDANAATAAA